MRAGETLSRQNRIGAGRRPALDETGQATERASGSARLPNAYGMKGNMTVSTTWMTPLLVLMFTKSGTTPMD